MVSYPRNQAQKTSNVPLGNFKIYLKVLRGRFYKGEREVTEYPEARAEALQSKTTAPMKNWKHSAIRLCNIRPPVGQKQKSTHKELVDKALAVRQKLFTEINLDIREDF